MRRRSAVIRAQMKRGRVARLISCCEGLCTSVTRVRSDLLRPNMVIVIDAAQEVDGEGIAAKEERKTYETSLNAKGIRAQKSKKCRRPRIPRVTIVELGDIILAGAAGCLRVLLVDFVKGETSLTDFSPKRCALGEQSLNTPPLHVSRPDQPGIEPSLKSLFAWNQRQA